MSVWRDTTVGASARDLASRAPEITFLVHSLFPGSGDMEVAVFLILLVIGAVIAIKVTRIVIRLAIALGLAAAFYVFLFPKMAEYYPKVRDLLQ